MKNLVSKILMLLVLLIALPVFAFCQEVAGTVPTLDISQFFITLGALAGATMALTQFVLKKWIKTKGKITMYSSWIIALILSAFGWYFQLGVFAGIHWAWIIAYGLAAGFVGNKIFDEALANGILLTIKNRSKN